VEEHKKKELEIPNPVAQGAFVLRPAGVVWMTPRAGLKEKASNGEPLKGRVERRRENKKNPRK
jgi:hypothetical protein